MLKRLLLPWPRRRLPRRPQLVQTSQKDMGVIFGVTPLALNEYKARHSIRKERARAKERGAPFLLLAGPADGPSSASVVSLIASHASTSPSSSSDSPMPCQRQAGRNPSITDSISSFASRGHERKRGGRDAGQKEIKAMMGDNTPSNHDS